MAAYRPLSLARQESTLSWKPEPGNVQSTGTNWVEANVTNERKGIHSARTNSARQLQRGYSCIAKWARAAGGRNSIRTSGDGPEKAVREPIGSLIGRQYRVTHGRVVRTDVAKSGRMDIIIVRDVPASTRHRTEEGKTDLVGVEWVAAVGEVKASRANRADVIRNYRRMVEDMETLQERRLVENEFRFGTMRADATITEMAKPATG